MTESRQHTGIAAIYRHDVHKFTGHSHATAPETFAGVPVNQQVPYGADGDAAALSRPDDHEQTVTTHANQYRLSLLTGESQSDADQLTRAAVDQAIERMVTPDDPTTLHRRWLDSNVAAAFNESVYYPYTSLKYHTLLVAALFAAYDEGHSFDDLALVIDRPNEVVPHRTIYTDPEDAFALRIAAIDDSATADRPATRLGDRPHRSWARTWTCLPAHPLAVDDDQWARTLDANLRRIRSWSTALQYLEDVRAWEGRQ